MRIFLKKNKLEHQLINEIKAYAGVSDFSLEDAKKISKLLMATKSGNDFAMWSAISVLEKYPVLAETWDELIEKYRRLGLF